MKIHAHFRGAILCGIPASIGRSVPLESLSWSARPANERCKRCSKVRITLREPRSPA
jgi:hypothetical protein